MKNDDIKLEHVYNAGKVVRYHTDPWFSRWSQTVADHTWGMTAIVFKFNPNPSVDLLKAITFHDSGEYLCGDIPYPFKVKDPETAAKHAKVEDEVLLDMGVLCPLGETDHKWLKFADRLEAMLFMFCYQPELEERPDWQSNYKACLATAFELGIEDEFIEFMGKARKSKDEKWKL